MSTATPPSVPGPIEPPTQDDQHLKLLAIFYYISAGLGLIGACIGVFYAVLGIVMMAAPVEPTGPNEPPVEVLGGAMIGLGALVLLLSAVGSVLQLLTARFIGARRHRIFCMVIAGINCLSVPLGTILGVFTFIVLARPSVVAQFNAASPAPPAAGPTATPP